MPAIHEFKFRNKVLQFSDTDIVNAVEDKSNIDHASFMAACRCIITGKPSERIFSDSEWEDIRELKGEQLDKLFQFSMTSLVKEVYAL